ncbi:MAG: TfuA-related McrA-glycine thioamidation protein [Nitrospirae bacterium YQR-1]
MKSVIFLGPTMPIEEAMSILDTIYLPPVEQATLLSAVTTYKPDVIGIIDGLFGQTLSVWHKEILYALQQGIMVYGASSMGALRAAETSEFGMIGVGEIYEMYASGQINDDDEVAVIHSSKTDGYRCLSEPMVNIRRTFHYAMTQGIIDNDSHSKLIYIAKKLYYPERVFQNIFTIALENGISKKTIDRLRLFVKTDYIDLKKKDAVKLLKTIRDIPEGKTTTISDKHFTMVNSHLFKALYNRDRTVQYDGIDIHQDNFASYVALHMPEFNDFNFNAINRALVVFMADYFEITVPVEDIEKEKERFIQKIGVKNDDELAKWITDNHLTPEEFNTLMNDHARCRRMHKWFMTRQYLVKNVKVVLDELRLQNTYRQWLKGAANQEQIIQNHYPDFKETEHKGQNIKELIVDHMKKTGWRSEISAMEWVEEAGFADLGHLHLELLRAKLQRNHIDGLIGSFLNNME